MLVPGEPCGHRRDEEDAVATFVAIAPTGSTRTTAGRS